MADKKHLTETEKKYDEICGMTMVNIYSLSKNCDNIPFWCVDINNPEHLYVLNVALGLGSAYGKDVVVSGSKFMIWKLNRIMGLKKGSRIKQMNGRDACYAIQPQRLNDDIRNTAKELCGPLFTFCDIYREFYERKKK